MPIDVFLSITEIEREHASNTEMRGQAADRSGRARERLAG